MRAELSKGAEVIVFEWEEDDPDYKNSVQIERFNLTFSSHHYYKNMMGRESARAYWDGLIRCGFRQGVSCVRI